VPIEKDPDWPGVFDLVLIVEAFEDAEVIHGLENHKMKGESI